MDNLGKKIIIGKNIKFFLSIWVTGGQEEFIQIRKLTYTEVSCKLSYSKYPRNLDSLEAVDEVWIPEIKHKEYLAENGCKEKTFPFFIVGNKSDLEQNNDNLKFLREKANRIVSAKNGICELICSAKEGILVNEVFEKVVRELYKRKYKHTRFYSCILV
eukprot:snap_masked-scaffold_6-processed-gene-2.27-mRNA-1 protein AED:0.28 eAED:1.00 QI:0/0/0/1/1/1/3/0/158